MKMKKTRENTQDVYTRPIETPLNSCLFEEKIIETCLLSSPPPPPLPSLSPLPLSPQPQPQSQSQPQLHPSFLHPLSLSPQPQPLPQPQLQPSFLHPLPLSPQPQPQLHPSFLNDFNLSSHQLNDFNYPISPTSYQFPISHQFPNVETCGQKELELHRTDIMCSEENRFLHPTTDMELLLEKETTARPEDVPANYHRMSDIIMCSSSEENTFLHPTIGMAVLPKKETAVHSPKGKDIAVLKNQYEKEKREIEEEEEEECVGKKIELRTTTKIINVFIEI